ncbi:MAG: transglutaminase family protein [Rhizobiales bacterium]|nr:transglutaminase family protein [Hyphomicrobiales bacterium]
MRIAISHTTTCRYPRPTRDIIQTLRLTPRNSSAQHVARWRTEIDADARLRQGEDAFGNIIHSLDAPGPLERFSIHVEGEVETFDTAGVLTGAAERFPPELYLRSTSLTAINPEMAEYAESVRPRAPGDDRLALMHALMAHLATDVAFDPHAPEPAARAADAFAARRGGGQDHAHLFCIFARHLGTPARFISGYFSGDGAVAEQDAGHSWAEAHIPGLGWIGFDAAHRVCSTAAHIRVAAALDALGAAPVRSGRGAAPGETQDVAIRTRLLRSQG